MLAGRLECGQPVAGIPQKIHTRGTSRTRKAKFHMPRHPRINESRCVQECATGYCIEETSDPNVRRAVATGESHFVRPRGSAGLLAKIDVESLVQFHAALLRIA